MALLVDRFTVQLHVGIPTCQRHWLIYEDLVDYC